jgi:hypothetical protein
MKRDGQSKFTHGSYREEGRGYDLGDYVGWDHRAMDKRRISAEDTKDRIP